ncbi:MAG: NUDIX hydrolase [Thermoanaerobaculales bacterium]
MRRWTVGALGSITKENQLLLVRRSFAPHQWGLPGGYVEEGEAPEQALLRELEEEGGVAPIVTSFVGVYVKTWESNINFIFAARLGSGPLRTDLAEVEAAGFWDPGALPSPISQRHYWIIQDCKGTSPLASLWVFKSPSEGPLATRGFKVIYA